MNEPWTTQLTRYTLALDLGGIYHFIPYIVYCVIGNMDYMKIPKKFNFAKLWIPPIHELITSTYKL
jgi:hypothetical protein